jgi:1-acyl-sn-glycerol-3-phosphate acyltransferase
MRILIIILFFLLIIYYTKIFFSISLIYTVGKNLLNGNKTSLRESVYKIYNNFLVVKHNFELIPETPCIIVCNHPVNFFDSIGTILIPKNLVFISAYGNSFSNAFRNKLLGDMIYVGKKQPSYESIKSQIATKLAEKKFIGAYVSTGKPTSNGVWFGRVRTGMFRIAKELDVPLVPIIFDKLNLDKNQYKIKVYPPIKIIEPEKEAYNFRKLLRKYYIQNCS